MCLLTPRTRGRKTTYTNGQNFRYKRQCSSIFIKHIPGEIEENSASSKSAAVTTTFNYFCLTSDTSIIIVHHFISLSFISSFVEKNS